MEKIRLITDYIEDQNDEIRVRPMYDYTKSYKQRVADNSIDKSAIKK